MARASIPVLAAGALVERLTRCLMHRGAPRKGLPALHDDIDISGAELETVAAAAGHFGRYEARARAAAALRRGVDRVGPCRPRARRAAPEAGGIRHLPRPCRAQGAVGLEALTRLGTESLQTPRWRGVDSKFQFRDSRARQQARSR